MSNQTPRSFSILLGFILAACGDDDPNSQPSDDDGGVTTPRMGYPEFDTACQGPAAEPTTLVVSATDFATGSVGRIEIASRTVEPDLALASTDIALAADEDRVFAINRFGFDNIDILDRSAGLTRLGGFSVEITEDRSANPHTLWVDDEDQAFVTMFGDTELQIWDLADPASPERAGSIDLSALADADGLPEMGQFVPCGDVAFVAIERLDPQFVQVDNTWLVPIYLPERQTYEFSDAAVDGIPLLGVGMTRYRLDPSDPGGRSILVLNSGLERVDLTAGESEWVIADTAFASAGLVSQFQIRDFDLAADGTLYFAFSSADFSEHSLWRASLAGEGADLEQIFTGLQTVNGNLEVVGDELWFADTTVGSSGLRVFDVGTDPVTEVAGSPWSVGLPPYGLLALD